MQGDDVLPERVRRVQSAQVAEDLHMTSDGKEGLELFLTHREPKCLKASGFPFY